MGQLVETAKQEMAKVRSKTDALVSGMSCINPMQADVAESEIQIQANPLSRGQTLQQVGSGQNNCTGHLAACPTSSLTTSNEEYNALQEAIKRSLQDEEEKSLQQAIALSLVEAENDNMASSACGSMDGGSSKAAQLQDSEPMVHDDLIDLGQHDLLDLADSAPASISAPPTIEKELIDVFPAMTMSA